MHTFQLHQVDQQVQRVHQRYVRYLPWLVLLLALALFTFTPEVYAQTSTDAGGKIEGFLKTIKKALGPISVLIVTIAFLFAGFQIAFNHKRIGDVAPVVIGAIVIGAATQLANWFISQSDFQ